MLLDAGDTLDANSAFVEQKLRQSFAASKRVDMRMLVANLPTGRVVLAGRIDILSRHAALPPSVDLGTVMVVTKSVSAAEVEESFIRAAAGNKRFELGDGIVADPGPNTRWSAFQLGSGRGNDYGDWPCIDFRLGLPAGKTPRLPSPLLTPSSHLYRDVHELYGEMSGIRKYSNSDNRSSELVVVLHDERARLASVAIQKDGIHCCVEGSSLDGLMVTLRVETEGLVTRTALPAEPVVVFPMNGRPDEAEVALVMGSELRDYKDRWEVSGHDAAPGDLVTLVSVGENGTLEFKQWMDVGTGDKRNEVLCTAIAFANGEGGAIIIGVMDDGSPQGSAQAGRYLKEAVTEQAGIAYGVRLRDFIQQNVNHALDLTVTVGTIGAELVCVLRVASGQEGRVHMTTPGNKVFIRTNATTRHPTERELKELADGSSGLGLQALFGKDGTR